MTDFGPKWSETTETVVLTPLFWIVGAISLMAVLSGRAWRGTGRIIGKVLMWLAERGTAVGFIAGGIWFFGWAFTALIMQNSGLQSPRVDGSTISQGFFFGLVIGLSLRLFYRKVKATT